MKVFLSYRWLKDSVPLTAYESLTNDYSIDDQTKVFEPYNFKIPKSFSDGSYDVELRLCDSHDTSNSISKFFRASMPNRSIKNYYRTLFTN